MTKDEVLQKVNNAKVNELIDLTGYSHYTEVMFDQDSDNKYCWTLKRNDWVGCIFPMKNTQYVKTFRTFNGAKRNLMKRIGLAVSND